MFIKPSRQPFDPKLQLRTAGTFYCILSNIQEIDPDQKYDSKKNRLVFEFTVVDRKVPHLNGQKGVTIVTATVYHNRNTGQRSNLVKLATSMGVVNPEKGFDPDMLLDKHYYVRFELYEGKSYAVNVIPAAGPGDKGQPEQESIKPFAPDGHDDSVETVPF